jgi:hypothetical protein
LLLGRVVLEAERVKCSPPGIALHRAGATALIPVGTADRTETLAVGPTQGRNGQFEENGVVHERQQIDDVTVEGIGLLVLGAGFST